MSTGSELERREAVDLDRYDVEMVSAPMAKLLRDRQAQVSAAEKALTLAGMPNLRRADIEVRGAAVMVIDGDTEADAFFAAGLWAKKSKPAGAVIQAMTPGYMAPSRFGQPPGFRILITFTTPHPDDVDDDAEPDDDLNTTGAALIEPPLIVEDSREPIDGQRRR